MFEPQEAQTRPHKEIAFKLCWLSVELLRLYSFITLIFHVRINLLATESAEDPVKAKGKKENCSADVEKHCYTRETDSEGISWASQLGPEDNTHVEQKAFKFLVQTKCILNMSYWRDSTLVLETLLV